MNRRNFLKISGAASAFATLPSSFKLMAAPQAFTGKFLVTLQLLGAWDVSSICDPKMNVPGEDEINHWARRGETKTAGNLHYADFADNQAFFDRYHKDMLVINGIDAQTNSHNTGVTHNFSGRISAGFPTLTSLYAASQAPELPIAYINNGGYSETSGLVRYSRLDNDNQVRNVVNPDVTSWDANSRWVHQDDWDLVNKFRDQRMQAALTNDRLSIRERLALSNYSSALSSASVLNDFSSALSQAGALHEDEVQFDIYSNLKRQMQLALIAMKSGVSVAADLFLNGFDTHSRHNQIQGYLLGHATQSIDFFWRYAQELGIADRMVLVVNSDFSRTPYYNATQGKDHWPVGSAIIMEQGAPWGNRVVGATDGGQNVIPINPNTLQQQASGGSIIYPKHVMKSLRQYLEIDSHPLAAPFAINTDESFDFFNAAQSTPQMTDPRNSIRV